MPDLWRGDLRNMSLLEDLLERVLGGELGMDDG